MVGALPKYLNRADCSARVVIPKYQTEWIEEHHFEAVFNGKAPLGNNEFNFSIQQLQDSPLGFDLFVADIPRWFDRKGIYADPRSGSSFNDLAERFMSFQIAVLEWVGASADRPDIIHCHDYHTALLPFMLTQCHRYDVIKHLPTALTIHNGEYQGRFDWQKTSLIPPFNFEKRGLLEWDQQLNWLAAGLKTCWQITTVSPTYMQELCESGSGLERLFRSEQQKSLGILNGIDDEVWNPEDDAHIPQQYDANTVQDGKKANKKVLCKRYGLNPNDLLVAFIGRLAYEKGADLLPDLFSHFIEQGHSISFLLLGTGNPDLHQRFSKMNRKFSGNFHAILDYDELLAHQIYAGSDFMIMPSRVEPCGLNQLYAMRYGSVPIVRNVGGLKDTVDDLGESGGYGITFENFNLPDSEQAVEDAIQLYDNMHRLNAVRKRIMKLDFSWNASAKRYIKMYQSLLK